MSPNIGATSKRNLKSPAFRDEEMNMSQSAPGEPVPTPYPYDDAPAFPTNDRPGADGHAAARVHGAEQLPGLRPLRHWRAPRAAAAQCLRRPGLLLDRGGPYLPCPERLPAPGRLRALRHGRGNGPAEHQRLPVARIVRDADQRRALQHQRAEPGQERVGARARSVRGAGLARSSPGAARQAGERPDPRGAAAAGRRSATCRPCSPQPARPISGSPTTTRRAAT